MCECVWRPVIDGRPIQGVLLPCAQYSCNRLQIHHNPELDKGLTENENELS